MADAQYSDTAPGVIWLRGEHDASTAAELARTIAWAVSADHADLVIDMHDVEFISVATVGVLVRARTFLRARSRSLTVRSPSRCVRRLLALCDLNDLIDEATTQRAETQQIA